MADDAFPNYLAMPTRVPLSWWRAVRLLSVAVLCGVVVLVLVDPTDGLALFWGVLVPVLPLVFLVAPGAWRNVCPLAALNQSSRTRGVSRAATPPPWLAEYGFVIASGTFVAIVIGRKIWFNDNGVALAVLLVAVMATAALGGWLLKGKSGWCSSICPLLPVQRVYGQTPFVGVPNSHCRPCVGCTKNCYDFNPRVAYVADMHDPDPTFRGYRRFFVAAFPGLVQGFFVVPDVGSIGLVEMLGRVGLWVAGSAALFWLLDTYAKVPANRLPPLFGAAAFTIFYVHAVRRMASALEELVGGSWDVVVWPIRFAAIGLAAVWLVRSWRVESRFLAAVEPTPVRVDLSRARAALEGDDVEVRFGDVAVVVARGATLLDAAERAGVAIESGCRQGVCGADPVGVIAGADELSEVRRDEADTLARLGLGPPNRMACVARANGSCAISLTPDRDAVPANAAPAVRADPDLERVVIVGNGIAGVTTADFLRRYHPDVTIDVIGAEPHHLYNRMGIARVVVGRSAMQGLYLLPDHWYEDHRIGTWLNTTATMIDRAAKRVRFGIRDELPYDRLVLATGGRSFVPPIAGFGLPGSFVLREAADAIALRAGGQGREHPRAIVAGGGLLGLEAAHTLHELGLQVTVLERSDRLLRRPLDQRASEMLRSYFEAAGIEVRVEIEVAAVDGDGRVERALTPQGESLPCDVVLVAAGVTPNVELAVAAGLDVGQGIVVDDRMRTSDPDTFAVGDVAEFEGRTWGLWPVAVKQARIAATVIAGGDDAYVDEVPKTTLKGCGLDLVSFGVIDAAPGDVVVVDEAASRHRYRKVVLRNGAPIGAIFLGTDEGAADVEDAVNDARVFPPELLERWQRGDWSVLGADALVAVAG